MPQELHNKSGYGVYQLEHYLSCPLIIISIHLSECRIRFWHNKVQSKAASTSVAKVVYSVMMKTLSGVSLTYMSSLTPCTQHIYSVVASVCSTLPSMSWKALVHGSVIPCMSMVLFITCAAHIPSLLRRRRGTVLHAMMMMVAVGLMMTLIPRSTSFTCPTSCYDISPLPFPFGASPGCGSPGFQLTNCSIRTPLWSLTLAGTTHLYYIKSINTDPRHGYNGTVQLYLNPSTYVPPFCQLNPSSAPLISSFTTSNFYAFKDAELTYYQDSYLFFDCTASLSTHPGSGKLKVSSPSYGTYLRHCNFSAARPCLEFVPDKELQLASLLRSYNCSSLRRFVILNENDHVSAWVSATQFAWGQVGQAENCSSCQSSGGTCGYNTQDNDVFQCYCGNETHAINCYHTTSGSGKMIGIGVSISAIFLLVFLGIAYYYRHECLHYYNSLFRKKRLNLDGANRAPLELSYGELAVATKSFSTKIGQGAFGNVYRGVLSDGIEVAVKVLDASVSHTDGQFMNEVTTIGNIHHVNVARLVGFCFQKSRRMLVYEYVSHGSLDKYLFPSAQLSSGVVLTRKQRYDIALGIARGLSYMHEDCRSCIIHCDIKPQNILVDAAFCPKIADFGLAHLLAREESRVLTQARGTPGYVAPEFWSLRSGPLTAKFDVYSYGILLLEIVRGKRGFHDYFQEESEDEMHAWMSVYVDERIEDGVDMEQAKLCTHVAMWCIQDNPKLRPAMSRVVQFLQGTAPVPNNPPRPFTNVFSKGDDSQGHRTSSDFLLSSSLEQVLSIDSSCG